MHAFPPSRLPSDPEFLISDAKEEENRAFQNPSPFPLSFPSKTCIFLTTTIEGLRIHPRKRSTVLKDANFMLGKLANVELCVAVFFYSLARGRWLYSGGTIDMRSIVVRTRLPLSPGKVAQNLSSAALKKALRFFKYTTLHPQAAYIHKKGGGR